MFTASFSLLLAAVLASSPTYGQVPRRVFPEKTGQGVHPLWVSADEAVDGSSLRWELFREAQQRSLEADLRTAQEAQLERELEPAIARRASRSADPECLLLTLTSGSNIENPTLQRLFDGARIAVMGTIVDGADGFWNAEPSALYEVRVNTIFKDPLGIAKSGQLLVRHSVAKVRVGDLYLCAGDDHSLARPAIGRRILVLSPLVITADPVVVVGDSYFLFFEDSKGRVQVPRGYSEDLTRWATLEDEMKVIASHDIATVDREE